MISGFALVALIIVALVLGWFLGVRAAQARNDIEALIAADTRAAFVDDAAELAIDNEPAEVDVSGSRTGRNLVSIQIRADVDEFRRQLQQERSRALGRYVAGGER